MYVPENYRFVYGVLVCFAHPSKATNCNENYMRIDWNTLLLQFLFYYDHRDKREEWRYRYSRCTMFTTLFHHTFIFCSSTLPFPFFFTSLCTSRVQSLDYAREEMRTTKNKASETIKVTLKGMENILHNNRAKSVLPLECLHHAIAMSLKRNISQCSDCTRMTSYPNYKL